ncbi:hypothetical protein L6R53_16090 [Myxococcota bacterium]|nr:hypothetical protein [Myxococcota bacterium]
MLSSLALALALSTAGPARAAAPIGSVALAWPFSVDQPFPHAWRADQPAVREGLVLVVGVDPQVARPRQGPHPVLYVGDMPAERLSWSATAPWLVVLVPGPVDLARTPVFWGDETLPEQVDPEHGQAQLEAARQAGIAPLAPQATALPLRVADQQALLQAVAPLVQQWAPLPRP